MTLIRAHALIEKGLRLVLYGMFLSSDRFEPTP